MNAKLKFLSASCLLTVSLTVTAGDFRSFAPTPPMGWNSWDCYGPSVTEKAVYDNANYIRDKGLLELGWNYIIVDIRWYTNDTGFWYNTSSQTYHLDDYGRYMPNTDRFPSSAGGVGFKALADSLHRMGFKFGIHIMRGVPIQAVNKKLPVKGTDYTCDQIYNTDSLCTWLKDNYTVDCRKPGAQEYYNSLLELYASWGVDFLKVDDLSRPYHDGEIWLLRNAIDHCGRNIVFSLSPGATDLRKWQSVQQHANMWRMMDDLWDNWSDVQKVFSLCADWNQYRREGNYPDCDMLPLGRLRLTGGGGPYNCKLTHDEQRTMLTLWSIFKSPLFFAGNFPDNDDWTNGLISNEEVISINQHSRNNRQMSNNGQAIAWTADAPEGSGKYVALFNVSGNDQWIRYNEALHTTETISLLTDGYAADVNVSIPAGTKRLALVCDDSGDGYSYDHGDWVNPTVILSDGTERLLTKDDVIREDYSGSFFKRINYDQNIEGNGKLNINGTTYDNGWSCNANAMVLYQLPENAVAFRGRCGIDDSGRLQQNATSSMKFMVFADDPTRRTVCNPAYAAAKSGLVSRTYQSGGTMLEADIPGAEKLYLVVTNAGDNFNYDHANWIHPVLIDAGGNETPLTSIQYDSSVTDWHNISNYGKNVDGGPLNVAGTTYTDGIGTNSNSVITYTLPAGHPYVRLRSFCGYDYDMRNAPNGVTMEFLVFTSNPLGSDSLAIPLDLPALGFEADEQCEVYDVWAQQPAGTYSGTGFAPLIPSHGCGLYRITPTGAGTGMMQPHTSDGRQRKAGGMGQAYDLNGRCVNARQTVPGSLSKGLYITGEKKIVIK